MVSECLKPIARDLKAHHWPIKLMGCQFVITAVDESPRKAWEGIRGGVSEIQRIEALISSWKSTSETSAINRGAGERAVRVSSELFDLIERSLRWSKMTSGAFDISGSLSRDYWCFDNCAHPALSNEQLDHLRNRMDYRCIDMDREHLTVYLRRKGMKIGFGGIGKGYAANQAAAIMQKTGIRSGLINAAGDLMCWGSPPGKNDWKIHIPHPEYPGHSLMQVDIPSGSVVTSGNYEKYTLIDGQRYGHIVDPRTGWPVTGLKSVSVMCPHAELGDALATAITVLGVTEGLELVNRIDGASCILMDNDDQVFMSDSLNYLTY